jgi:hypothetical protein
LTNALAYYITGLKSFMMLVPETFRVP